MKESQKRPILGNIIFLSPRETNKVKEAIVVSSSVESKPKTEYSFVECPECPCISGFLLFPEMLLIMLTLS